MKQKQKNHLFYLSSSQKSSVSALLSSTTRVIEHPALSSHLLNQGREGYSFQEASC
jgi:hypothetical protein